MEIETMAIHAGFDSDPVSGAVMPPIYQTSTYKQERVGKHKGYEYSRTGNPTRTVLEANLAAIERGRYGLAFASGMAAIDTVLRLLTPGDHVIAGNDVYGGTFRLFDKVYRKIGVEFTYINPADLSDLSAAIRPETKMVWFETPTNPLLTLTDIEGVNHLLAAASAGSRKPLLIIDNTFATPYLQRPLTLGADIVVHSTTKYLGGHSDVVGGAAIMNDPSIRDDLAFLQNAVGAVPGPMDCFLVLRGIKTLHVRMDRHAENALKVAEYLQNHPKVSEVRYPYLKTHPQYDLAKRQMRNGGGIVSVVIKGGGTAASQLVENTKLFTLAESLGGVESLIEVPAVMTHLSVAGSPLEVDAGLVRLSVGIENVDDLRRDLEQAFTYV